MLQKYSMKEGQGLVLSTCVRTREAKRVEDKSLVDGGTVGQGQENQESDNELHSDLEQFPGYVKSQKRLNVFSLYGVLLKNMSANGEKGNPSVSKDCMKKIAISVLLKLFISGNERCHKVTPPKSTSVSSLFSNANNKP